MTEREGDEEAAENVGGRRSWEGRMQEGSLTETGEVTHAMKRTNCAFVSMLAGSSTLSAKTEFGADYMTSSQWDPSEQVA